jgi:hypothetical protein
MYGLGGRGQLKRSVPKSARPVAETVGPFKGMRTTLQGSLDPSFAEWLHNCYPMNPYHGGELVPRPGRRPYPLPDLDGTLRHQLPNHSGDSAIPHGEFQLLTSLTGTVSNTNHRLVAIVDQKFYATRTGPVEWTEALTSAQLSSAGITITAFSRHYAVMFNGKLIVVGPSYVFSWDGTAGGGVVHLANAGSSFYGRPVVYAGKLFLIRGNRKTIVWSEEGDETTGYEAGGFNNAWDLRQTSQELITSLLATNEALYFFRRTSIGAVFGGSADEFQTTSTIDAVSATIGTETPESPIIAGNSVWFLDQQGRPNYFLLGSNEIVPVWHEIERAFTPYTQDGIGYDRLAEPNAETASFLGFDPALRYFPALDLVLIPYSYASTLLSQISSFDVVVGFNATTKRAQTVWSFPTRTMDFAVVKDTEYITSQGALVQLDEFGWSYAVVPSVLGSIDFELGSIDPSIWYTDRVDQEGKEDPGVPNGKDVNATCIGPRHFGSIDAELRASRLDVEYLGWRSGSTMSVRWAVPETLVIGGGADEWTQLDGNTGGNSPTTPMVTIPLEGMTTDPTASVPPVPGHAEVGLDEIGRWFAFAFSWKGQASRARLVRWKLEAVVEGREREAY